MKTSIRCVALGVAMASIGLAGAQSTLKSVSVDKDGPGVGVLIKGTDLPKPTTLWNRGKGVMTLEFKAKLGSSIRRQAVNNDGLRWLAGERMSSTKGAKVRVYFGYSGKPETQVTQTAEGWLVSFNRPAPVQTVAKNTAPKQAEPLYYAQLPPIEPASSILARVSGPVAAKSSAKAISTDSPADKARVSLEFINTEIVQILKALAMQAGVNIVTAPEVKGSLTVALDNVTVKEALDMVTTVSGLRYQRIGNSFVVTTPEKFNGAVAILTGKKSSMMETRVVPIHSGSGREIRASVLTSMADNPTFGQYQIFLPDENFKLEKKSSSGPQGESSQVDVSVDGNANKGNAPAQKSDDQADKATSLKGLKEQYLVLVGPDSSIDEVEDRIRLLDREIARAHGFETSTSSMLVRKAYRVQSPDVTATALVNAFGNQQEGPFLNVDMYATPDMFQNQVVVLVGREAEVNRAESMLKALDYSGYGNNVFVYDVKYADPRALREELVSQVKGLRVTIPSASAATPRLYEAGKAGRDAAQRVTHAGMVELNSAGQVSSAAEPKSGQSDANSMNLNKPFEEFEKIAVPMRLTLTGTSEQINDAKLYLAQVDIAPKQIALELRVMELSKEDALRFGLNWDLTTGGSVTNLSSFKGLPEGREVSGSIIDGAFGLDVTMTLDQIANKDNLIARPNLMAVDGRESELFVGDVIRYIESIQSTQNGVTVTTDEVSVGVRLAVIPRVGDGFITMDLRPVVSFLTGFTPVPGGGALPQTSVRMSQSTVTMRSGETIAIGGLIQDQELKRLSKIPILGDLPVLGHLFRQTERSRERRELVFFLTAREITSAEDRATAASPRHNAAKYPPEILQGQGQPVKQ